MDFSILTVGHGSRLIRELWDPVEATSGITFWHVPDPMERTAHAVAERARWIPLREENEKVPGEIDRSLLAALEDSELPTIHNMILGDRVVRDLPYPEALAWTTFLAKRLEQIYLEVQPEMVLGGFDGAHSGVAAAAAKQLGIPWFALNFTTIPAGRFGFTTRLDPGAAFGCTAESEGALSHQAAEIVEAFQRQLVEVPTYRAAQSVGDVVRRLPAHLRIMSKTLRFSLFGKFDQFTQYSSRRLAREYVRKKLNLLRMPSSPLLLEPPSDAYVLFGLHMQPETSIDVWASFYADQDAVVEAIARAMPPTHSLLVKLHGSDADNYSPRRLKRLQNLPGVRLVSPFQGSRPFIERCSLVIAIQGTMALEAAMLGKPVLLFGESPYIDMPTVRQVGRVTDLPEQIRAQLGSAPPSQHEIVAGVRNLLERSAPGVYNDWSKPPTASEIENVAVHLKALAARLSASGAAGGRNAKPER